MGCSFELGNYFDDEAAGHPLAADDQDLDPGPARRNSGQGTRWYQAANVSPARRGLLDLAPGIADAGRLQAVTRTRSSPTSFSDAAQQLHRVPLDDRTLRPPGRAAGPVWVAAARPAARA